MPSAPHTISNWTPTGRRRHRRSVFGLLILQIEEGRQTGRAGGNGPIWSGEERRWRDAKWSDLVTED